MKEIVITAELVKEKEERYTVYCPELDIYTQGEDIEEALNNSKEAAEHHIEEIGIKGLELRQVEHRELEIVI